MHLYSAREFVSEWTSIGCETSSPYYRERWDIILAIAEPDSIYMAYLLENHWFSLLCGAHEERRQISLLFGEYTWRRLLLLMCRYDCWESFKNVKCVL